MAYRGCHDASPNWEPVLRFHGLYQPTLPHLEDTTSSICPVPLVLILFPLLYENAPIALSVGVNLYMYNSGSRNLFSDLHMQIEVHQWTLQREYV